MKDVVGRGKRRKRLWVYVCRDEDVGRGKRGKRGKRCECMCVCVFPFSLVFAFLVHVVGRR